MKKLLITLTILMCFGILFNLTRIYHHSKPNLEREVSQNGRTLEIAINPVQGEYGLEELLDAIEQVESGGNPNPIGKNGEIGSFQIKKIYVDDCNRLLTLQGSKKRFTYKDRWDRDKSREMTAIVIQHYGKDFETMARAHNCPPKRYSKSTKPYWEKVKRELERR